MVQQVGCADNVAEPSFQNATEKKMCPRISICGLWFSSCFAEEFFLTFDLLHIPILLIPIPFLSGQIFAVSGLQFAYLLKKERPSTTKVNNKTARRFRYYDKKTYVNIIDWTKEWKEIVLLRDSVSLHELECQPASTFHCCISCGPCSKLEQWKCGSSVSLLMSPKAVTATGS